MPLVVVGTGEDGGHGGERGRHHVSVSRRRSSASECESGEEEKTLSASKSACQPLTTSVVNVLYLISIKVHSSSAHLLVSEDEVVDRTLGSRCTTRCTLVPRATSTARSVARLAESLSRAQQGAHRSPRGQRRRQGAGAHPVHFCTRVLSGAHNLLKGGCTTQ